MRGEDKKYRQEQSSERRHRKQKDKHKKKEKHKHRHRSRSYSEDERRRSSHQQSHKHQRSSYNDKYQEQQREPAKIIAENKIQIVKQLPNFEPSGILLTFYNARDGISLKFHEPPESRQPFDTWKMYIFKGEQVSNPITLSNSCYLLGKDQRVCDILCQNPSISRQHSVIQFRMIAKINVDGTYSQFIKPYIMDLQSTNGTFLNDQKIQSSRYYELLHRDVLKFGFSDREYVLVKDESAQAVQQQQEQME